MSNFQQQTISHNLWFVIQPNLLISKLEDSTICQQFPFIKCKIYHWFVKIWTKTKEHNLTSTYPSPLADTYHSNLLENQDVEILVEIWLLEKSGFWDCRIQVYGTPLKNITILKQWNISIHFIVHITHITGRSNDYFKCQNILVTTNKMHHNNKIKIILDDILIF